jgi:hypothetical protein
MAPVQHRGRHRVKFRGYGCCWAEREETIRDLRARIDTERARLDASEAERRRLSERLTGLLTHRQAWQRPGNAGTAADVAAVVPVRLP